MNCLPGNNVERGVSHFIFPFHVLLHAVRSWFSLLALLLVVLHGVTLCKSGRGVDASRGSPGVPPIFSVISSDLKLGNQADYVRRAHHHEGVRLYEQVRNKCRVYFLPLVWPCGEKGGPQGATTERDNEGEANRAVKESADKAANQTDGDTPEGSAPRAARGDDETPFEYLQRNLGDMKHKMESLAEHIAQSDVVIVPMNYHDILNKHLLDIPQFSNFLNVMDLLLYVNQSNDSHNVIFYIYNFHEDDDEDAAGGRSSSDDSDVAKEKASIADIVKSFLRSHWKDQYHTCVKERFVFSRDNCIDVDRWRGQIGKKRFYNRVKVPIRGNPPEGQITLSPRNPAEGKITLSPRTPPTGDRRSYSIFTNHRLDALKNLTRESYFVYNFFSNLKISILHEYLKLASQLKMDNFDSQSDAGKMKIKMTQVAKEVEMLLNKFLLFQLDKRVVKNEDIIEQIRKKQHSYLVRIVLTDLLEKYEHFLETLIRQLYQSYRQRIKKIKINSNMISQFAKEIKNMDDLFHLYNSSMSFVHHFKNKEDYFRERANCIALHMEAKMLQTMNEITIEIINYYISQGVYVRHYDFTSSFLSLRKYSFFSYILQKIADMLRNRISLSFNYLSPSAFGFSSYKDDLSLSPKRDLMITTSEMDQVEKM
ncbi:hypothetical protein C922_04033 [Plasmodium inui San Antonio 1]|uniref:Uncharacterized protein n=1 Tax=Plasmodium inui San Antonio 1 TaxID=1237626 RepID=W6ZXM3_9APIC|nr:hypothetical protein C922_04033 [Plasmodium inui San Antonio 1]EUD65527.1 hypothetical protein C922_04033 [Plasmodium inui San Antonio 1]